MRRFLFVIAAVMAAGCSDALGPGGDLTSLGLARQRWASRGYDAYTYTITTSCFCANVHPIRAVVSRDTVRTAVDLVTNQPVEPRFVMTIGQVFTLIQHGIENHADVLTVSYDQLLGYPAVVDYDGSRLAADDEIHIEVRDVGPAPAR